MTKTMNNFIMSAVAGLILMNAEAKADLLQCKPCPDGYMCDGKKKISCSAGYSDGEKPLFSILPKKFAYVHGTRFPILQQDKDRNRLDFNLVALDGSSDMKSILKNYYDNMFYCGNYDDSSVLVYNYIYCSTPKEKIRTDINIDNFLCMIRDRDLTGNDYSQFVSADYIFKENLGATCINLGTIYSDGSTQYPYKLSCDSVTGKLKLTGKAFSYYNTTLDTIIDVIDNDRYVFREKYLNMCSSENTTIWYDEDDEALYDGKTLNESCR